MTKKALKKRKKIESAQNCKMKKTSILQKKEENYLKKIKNGKKTTKKSLFKTCKHLADSLYQMLLAPDIRAVSMTALEHFSLDVMQCELYVPIFDSL
jgi:hypothetical protein